LEPRAGAEWTGIQLCKYSAKGFIIVKLMFFLDKKSHKKWNVAPESDFLASDIDDENELLYKTFFE
jgi:hypothetical protein